MTKFFILDDSNNVIPATEAEWESFHSKRYIVAKTIIGSGRGAVEIETSFSGTHEEDEDEQPELFRTWYFQDADDGVEDDYETWEAARAGHEAVVARWLKLFPDAERIDPKLTEPAEVQPRSPSRTPDNGSPSPPEFPLPFLLSRGGYGQSLTSGLFLH